MGTGLDTRPPEENYLQIVSLIGIATILVFYSDISTPLGLMTWILYFIPLFLTLYIRWQYGPFAVAGTAIILIGISYFLSPRDMSEIYAIMNRLFFGGMLTVSALLIWRHKKRELFLEMSEERYERMIESSPDTILIIKDGIIQFINTAGLEICNQANGANGKDCLNLFEPGDQELIATHIRKAANGARIELTDIRLRSSVDGIHPADVWMGEILWDGQPAVEMIIRQKK